MSYWMNNSNSCGYDPYQDPKVQQDYAIRHNAVGELQCKEQIKTEEYRRREEIKRTFEREREAEKQMGLVGTRIDSLDGLIVLAKNVGDRVVTVTIFEGCIKEVYKIIAGDTVLGYLFRIQCGKDETLTKLMPEEYLSNFDQLINFFTEYMLFHRPNMSKSKLLDYLKDYLKKCICKNYEVPYFPGWFKWCVEDKGKRTERRGVTRKSYFYQYIWHGQLGIKECESDLISKSILYKHMEHMPINKLVSSVLSVYNLFGDEHDGSVLFLYRMSAVFRYFIDYPVFEKNLLLLGKRENLDIIKDCLKILHMDKADVVVAANEKMKQFEEKIVCCPDNIVLIALDGCSSYTKMRMVDIVINSIYKDSIGTKISKSIPVFIDRQLSKEIDMTSFLIIEMNKVFSNYDNEKIRNTLGTFDWFIFETICRSGEHWPDKLRKAFKIRLNEELNQEQKMPRMTAVFKTVSFIIHQMLLENGANEEMLVQIVEFMDKGIEKISQLSVLSENIIESFLKRVVKTVEKDDVFFYEKKAVSDNTDYDGNIYYDNQLYYFPQQFMEKKILCWMDSGRRLSLLRDLKNNNILHSHNVEFNGYLVPIRITTISGNKKNIRVYAIERSFFELAYGIKLYERR